MPISVEHIEELTAADLNDLCQATEDAISDGIGFNWVSPPMREQIEAYWNGVLMVPERVLLAGRLDGAISASIQLVRPSKSKETSAFAARIESHFVAPWARGHGLARALLEQAEREAAKAGFSIVNLSVRETQTRAIRLYHDSGYTQWGVLPYHEYVNATMVAGHYFYKKIKPISELV